MVTISFSKRITVTTCEHANLAPPATCPQPACRGGAWGYPGSSSSLFPRSIVPCDLRIYGTSSKAASQDGLRPSSLEVPKGKEGWPSASIDQGSDPFTRPPPARDDTWALAPPVKTCASIIFSHAGAPTLFLPRKTALKLPPAPSRSKTKALGAPAKL
jgi:hypothetical protein